MICKKCGNQLRDGELVCSNCGERVEVNVVQGDGSVQQPVMSMEQQAQGMAAQQPVMDMNQPVQEMPAQQPAMEMNQQVQGMPAQQSVMGMNQPVQGVPAQQPAMEMNQPVQGMPAQQPVMGMNQQVQGMPAQQPAMEMNQPVQGMPAQQPAMGMNQQVQGMQTQQPQPSEKKSKSGLFIIIVLLLLVVIGGLVYYLFFGNKNTDSNINTNDNQSSSTVSSNTGTNDKTLTINGYTVTVPSDLKYETANNNGIEYLNVADNSSSMLATITVGPDNYDAYKSDYSPIQQSLQSNGYVSTYAVVNYGGREFLTFRFFYSDKSIYSNYFLTKISDTLIAVGYLYEGRNFSASNAYGYIDKIVDSVGGNGSSSNFSINDFKLDGDSNSFLQDIE